MASVEGTYLGGLLFLIDGLQLSSGGMKPIPWYFIAKITLVTVYVSVLHEGHVQGGPVWGGRV